MCAISSHARSQIATLWNPYRRVSSRGQRAQIRYSRGVRGEENRKRLSAILVLRRKYVCFHKSQHLHNSWERSLMVRIAVEARRRLVWLAIVSSPVHFRPPFLMGLERWSGTFSRKAWHCRTISFCPIRLPENDASLRIITSGVLRASIHGYTET